jgi:hypothetical protein
VSWIRIARITEPQDVVINYIAGGVSSAPDSAAVTTGKGAVALSIASFVKLYREARVIYSRPISVSYVPLYITHLCHPF